MYQVQLDEGEFDEALARVYSGGKALSEVFREPEPGDPVLIAQGYEYNRPMSVSVEDTEREWTERRLVVRSVRHAESAQAALQARVAKAKEQVEALNQRGRGRQHFEEVNILRQAANAIIQRYRVEDFLWLRYDQQTTSRSVRAYQDRPAYVKEESQATVEVRVDEAALELAARRLGWRIYSTNQPLEQLSLEQAVLAYRSEYLVERSLGRLKGRPLSLTPMYVQRDDHATGLIRLLSIALRVLTLLEFVGRRQLALEQANLAGLYAGNPKRETARPTAERLLETFQEITLTIVELPQQTICHMTPLSPVHLRILEILGFSAEVYMSLEASSVKPP